MSNVITGSGYLNNPVRTLLIADDNRPGSYPVEVSPVSAQKSSVYMRPYRDNVMPDTPTVYGQARVTFNDVPLDGSSVTITNASASSHQFFFRSVFPTLSVASNVVNTFALVSSTDRYLGRTPTESSIRRLAANFIEAVNSASGTLVVAAPTDKYNEVLLTQQIPGTSGNTSNSSTTSAVTIRNFTGGNSGTVRYPYGISVGDGVDTQGSEIVRRVISTTQSGTLNVPTSGRASLVSAYSDQHPYAVFQPYNEANAVQAFGAQEGSRVYGTKTRLYDEFFTRGSTSGSLDEPLWCKDKIEIDLTPSSETILQQSPGDAFPNYPMAYFSFSTRRWEPIGFGAGVLGPTPLTTLKDVLDSQYIGFSQGYGNILEDSILASVEVIDDQLKSQFTNTKKIFQETGWFTPIDTFGFPLHPKYHATASQQFPVSNLVDRPFLVEKIVYEYSASLSSQSTLSADEYRGNGGAFFILNQRKANPDPGQESSYTYVSVSETSGIDSREFLVPQEASSSNGPLGDHWTLAYDNGGIPRTMQLSTSGPNVYVDSIRDLVTFARFGVIWPEYSDQIQSLLEPGFPHPAQFMDLAVSIPTPPVTFPPTNASYNGVCTIAAPVRAATQNPAVSNILIGSALGSGGEIPVSPSNIISFYASKNSSTRNSIDIATGRAYNTEYFGPDISYKTNGYEISKKVFAAKSETSNSPYVIMPGDNLVFGWQSATYYSLQSGGAALKLGPNKGKLTLYGSYLRDNKPVHDIYKDQLNSDAVHETIPSGPWVLDRFESDPQMCYTGSLRELYVTGTMVTLGPDGKPLITDLNKLNSGSKGVRMVGASVSSGNVKQRWSFFRNYRLSCFEEQYYDSMQPDPVLTLFDHIGSTARPIVGQVGATVQDDVYAFIMPNGTYSGPGSFSTAVDAYANRTFIGSFPFDSIYSEIPRVPYIDAKTFNRQQRVKTGVTLSLNDTSISDKQFLYIGFGDTTDKKLSAKGALLKQGLPTGQTIYTPSTDNTGILDTNPVISDSDYSVIGTGSFLDIDEPSGKKINYHLSRFMGCFGDGYARLCTFTEQSAFFVSFMRGMIYRGARYGLINAIPQYSTAIFNGTHYGQFRDMLEQRQYTRFYGNSVETKKFRGIKVPALTVVSPSAVEVVFIDRQASPGTNLITSGSATNSSNISQFATSDHPYDDSFADYDQIWDRQTPLPEMLAVLSP